MPTLLRKKERKELNEATFNGEYLLKSSVLDNARAARISIFDVHNFTDASM